MRARDACAWAPYLMSVPERLQILAQSAFWKIAGPLDIPYLVYVSRTEKERTEKPIHIKN